MAQDSGFREGMGIALRLGVELIVATFIGVMMGYALDKFFDTRPWFLVLGVLFGGAAGSLNVYRIATASLPGDVKDPLDLQKNNKKQKDR